MSNDILNKKVINIVFHGLDTIAEIFINDQLIGKSDNMFVKYKFDIKEHLNVCAK